MTLQGWPRIAQLMETTETLPAHRSRDIQLPNEMPSMLRAGNSGLEAWPSSSTWRARAPTTACTCPCTWFLASPDTSLCLVKGDLTFSFPENDHCPIGASHHHHSHRSQWHQERTLQGACRPQRPHALTQHPPLHPTHTALPLHPTGPKHAQSTHMAPYGPHIHSQHP